MKRKEIYPNDIATMDQRYRAAFINSLGGFRSIALVGTRNRYGISNLAVFNSFFHVGANPPLFGFVVRPDSVERHTLANILETREFTVNHITADIYAAAHQTSAKYPADISEFDATGLTEEYKTGYFAPFVQESHIKVSARFRQKIEVKQNGTTIILAEVRYVSLPEEVIGQDGFVDLTKAGTITGSGLDSYHGTTQLGRLPYARPAYIAETLRMAGIG